MSASEAVRRFRAPSGLVVGDNAETAIL
jgi:hypothetical protein